MIRQIQLIPCPGFHLDVHEVDMSIYEPVELERINGRLVVKIGSEERSLTETEESAFLQKLHDLRPFK